MGSLSETLSVNTALSQLAVRLGEIVGAEHVATDESKRKLHSEDIWARSEHVVQLVVAPKTTLELAKVVKAVGEAGYNIAPRGGGMSYTSSYVPKDDRTVSIDTLRMDRILKISREDMTVTVQAGVTWVALKEALDKYGLRTPFWGPMSGLKSTIGGGLSQLNAMFGGSKYGTSSESVVALTLVSGSGEVIRTGARGQDGNQPFYRHYGPDITGLFCGDCGTLGVKAEITLRLIVAPAFEDYASFSFPTGEKLLEAMGEMTRQGIACEMCAFDPGLTEVRMKRMSLISDVKTLGAVIGKEKSFGKGLLSAAKVAFGGRNFIPKGDYPLHITAEGRSKEAVAADIAEARRIGSELGGTEIENSIAKIIRATPFPPLNSMLGPTGEAWIPIHGVCPISTAPQIFTEIMALFEEHAALIKQYEIHSGFLFTGMATNALILEPVFFWPTGWRPIHEESVEASHIARLTRRDENVEATEAVTLLRKGIVSIFKRYGTGHFQIGRTYPYRESRDEAFNRLLDDLKKSLDPKGVLNPGVLGFPN